MTKTRTIKITPEGMMAALAALDKADKRARLLAYPPGTDPELDALRVFIEYGLAHPSERFWRVLRKRAFLTTLQLTAVTISAKGAIDDPDQIVAMA